MVKFLFLYKAAPLNTHPVLHTSSDNTLVIGDSDGDSKQPNQDISLQVIWVSTISECHWVSVPECTPECTLNVH